MKRRQTQPSDAGRDAGVLRGPVSRRSLLLGAVGGVFAGTALAAAGSGETKDQNAAASADGIPGPFPGRVVEVAHAGSVADGQVRGAVVPAMMDRGMQELFASDDATGAWRSLFAPGDVVGIKVNPVGQPHSISNYATVRAVIAGLRSAKVRTRDILVFERYRRQFLRAGYAEQLPDGVRWDASVEDYDSV